VINFLQHSFSNIKCENKKNLTFSINFFHSRLKLCHIKNVTTFKIFIFLFIKWYAYYVYLFCFKRVSRKMHDYCRKANNHHQRRRRIIIDQSEADWLSYKKCFNIIGSCQLCSYQLITSNISSECKNFVFHLSFKKFSPIRSVPGVNYLSQ
jgi:hypothetical protein